MRTARDAAPGAVAHWGRFGIPLPQAFFSQLLLETVPSAQRQRILAQSSATVNSGKIPSKATHGMRGPCWAPQRGYFLISAFCFHLPTWGTRPSTHFVRMHLRGLWCQAKGEEPKPTVTHPERNLASGMLCQIQAELLCHRHIWACPCDVLER